MGALRRSECAAAVEIEVSTRASSPPVHRNGPTWWGRGVGKSGHHKSDAHSSCEGHQGHVAAQEASQQAALGELNTRKISLCAPRASGIMR